MTLTTGPVPVAAAVSVALREERRTRPVRASRTTVLAVVLDVLSADGRSRSRAPGPGRVGAGDERIVGRRVAVGRGARRRLRAAWAPTRTARSRALLEAAVSLAVALVGRGGPGAGSWPAAPPGELATETLVLAAAMPVGDRPWPARSRPSRRRVGPFRPRGRARSPACGRCCTRRTRCGPRAAFDPVAVCLPEPVGRRRPRAAGRGLAGAGPHGHRGPAAGGGAHPRRRAVVAVPGPQVGHAELRRWGAWLQDLGVDLLVSSGLRDVARGRLAFTTLGGADLVHVRPAPLSGAGAAGQGRRGPGRGGRAAGRVRPRSWAC